MDWGSNGKEEALYLIHGGSEFPLKAGSGGGQRLFGQERAPHAQTGIHMAEGLSGQWGEDASRR